MNILLSEIEARVLGALIEKEITTPEYYPLSLNALVNACNQKSNRDPVMNLDEGAVREALHSLRRKELAHEAGSDGRVTKYEHTMQEAFNFDRRETAISCVLLLRGPQTPGELRGRAERMHPFDDLTEVQSALQRLMNREPPIVKMLPRAPGTKEARYAHLLSGDVQASASARDPELAAATGASGGDGHVAQLEEQVAQIQRDIAELKRQFAAFRKQFE